MSPTKARQALDIRNAYGSKELFSFSYVFFLFLLGVRMCFRTGYRDGFIEICNFVFRPWCILIPRLSCLSHGGSCSDIGICKKKLFFSFIETYNNHFFFLAIVTEDITNTVHEFAKGWHDTRPNHTLIFWTINLTINLSKQQPRHNRINREDLQSIHINEYNAIDHHHRGLQGRRRGG